MKKIILLLFVIVISFSSGSYAAERSKIAVASEGPGEMSSISAKAARSPFFLIFDEHGALMEVVENLFKDASKGVGTSVVDLLSQKGVTALIAETFGDKTMNALKENGIAYYELQGSATAGAKKVIKK